MPLLYDKDSDVDPKDGLKRLKHHWRAIQECHRAIWPNEEAPCFNDGLLSLARHLCLLLVFEPWQVSAKREPQSQKNPQGLLLENTLPTRLLLALFVWSISTGRTPASTTASAAVLKHFLQPFRLSFAVCRLGDNLWHHASPDATGHLPENSLWTTSRVTYVLARRWQECLAF